MKNIRHSRQQQVTNFIRSEEAHKRTHREKDSPQSGRGDWKSKYIFCQKPEGVHGSRKNINVLQAFVSGG